MDATDGNGTRVADEQQGAAQPAAGPWTRRDIAQIALLLGMTAVLTALWRFTPLGERLDPQRLAEWAEPWRADPFAIVYVVAIHAVLGLVGFPITILVLAAALVFGPGLGLLYSWAGGLANATSGYVLGRLLTKPTLIEHLDRKGIIRGLLARHGTLSIAVLRNIPIGPFIVVNLIAGATRVKYRHYVVGTAIGMLPPLIVVVLGADRLLAALRNPGPLSYAALAATIVCVVLGAAWLRHRLRHHGQAPP